MLYNVHAIDLWVDLAERLTHTLTIFRGTILSIMTATKVLSSSERIRSERSGEFLWSLERYHYAIDNGTLTEEDKVELLYGKIIEKMPAGAPHEECITLISEEFHDRFGRKYRYRQEKSIHLSNLTSEPEPDLAVVHNKSYGTQRPGPEDVFLVVEVAQSSLEKDRTLKAELYAQANLPEYWIINLVDRQLEVYLQPLPEQGRYASVTTHSEVATFTSPFAGEITVAQFLPGPQKKNSGDT